MKKILLRFLGLIVILILAFCWIILNPKPAFAQLNTINYNNINLENRDFSNADLAGVTFVAAEMRGLSRRLERHVRPEGDGSRHAAQRWKPWSGNRPGQILRKPAL